MLIRESFIPVVEYDDGPMKGIWATHQIEVANALKEYEIVFNTFPTGSGKTLSLLNSIRLNNYSKALLIAPTNELLHQYNEEVLDYVRNHGMEHEVFLITSAALNRINPHSHSKGFESLLRKPGKVIYLCNPDIIHYVLSMSYGKKSGVRNRFVELTAGIGLDLIAFDEFHYYDLKRSFIAVLLISLKATFAACNWRLLFMSATPSDTIITAAKETGLSHYTIAPGIPGERTMPFLAKTEFDSLPGNIGDHLEQIVKRLNEWKSEGLDSVVISDSLERISRLSQALAAKGWEFGKDYGMITGPANTEERRRSLDLPLILATPTVDIGYNFSKPKKKPKRQNIECIVFEASNPSDLIQRLHRAGRVFFKEVTDFPSRGLCLCPKQFHLQVQSMKDMILDREAFVDMARTELPHWEDLTTSYYSAMGSLFLRVFRNRFKMLFNAAEASNEDSSLYRVLDLLGKSLKTGERWVSVEKEAFSTYYLFQDIKESRGQDTSLKERLVSISRDLGERELEKGERYYANNGDVKLAMARMNSFIEQLESFRGSASPVFIVRASPKFFGTSVAFAYDAFMIMSSYDFEVICVNEEGIPEVRVIGKKDKKQRPQLEIHRLPKSHGFFIPLRVKLHEVSEIASYVNTMLEKISLPMYYLGPNTALHARTIGYHPSYARCRGQEVNILVGEEALSAVGQLGGNVSLLPI
jgi:CRISPR-associated helicase Cas3